MRVILGKQGKSRVLESQMKQLDKDRILLVDSVRLHIISHLSKYYISVKTLEDVYEAFSEIEKDKELYNEIDYVILSLNAKIDSSEELLRWEKRLGKRFIITIQDDSVERILMFDQSLTD